MFAGGPDLTPLFLSFFLTLSFSCLQWFSPPLRLTFTLNALLQNSRTRNCHSVSAFYLYLGAFDLLPWKGPLSTARAPTVEEQVQGRHAEPSTPSTKSWLPATPQSPIPLQKLLLRLPSLPTTKLACFHFSVQLTTSYFIQTLALPTPAVSIHLREICVLLASALDLGNAWGMISP